MAFTVPVDGTARTGSAPSPGNCAATSWPTRSASISIWPSCIFIREPLLQHGRGLSALAAGAVFTFLAGGYLIISFQASALTIRFGRRVIAVGAVLAAVGDGALDLATDHGGSVSGALSTAQQVGNSIGVAVTGVLFFGALGHGYGLAFERSVLQIGALLL